MISSDLLFRTKTPAKHRAMEDPPAQESTKPAPAILASTFLDLELDRRQTAERQGPWRTGIKSLESQLPKELWMSGKVLGLASVDESEPVRHHIRRR
jgi:hypothetical protein